MPEEAAALGTALLDGIVPAPIFPAPEPPAPLRTSYWQQDAEPWDAFPWPDDLPGPVRHHMITKQAYEDVQRRKLLGLDPLCYTSPAGAPPGTAYEQPGGALPVIDVNYPPAAPSAPADAEHTPPPVSSGRAPRAPRPPRAPRVPRTPRAPRETRAPRAPRPPRPPRFSRRPRPPRPPRKPRPPRYPGTKGDEYEYFCAYDLATGRNAHIGSPVKVAKGAPNPVPAPGHGLRKVSGTFPCGEDQCTGPLAGIITGFFDLLPAAWRPGISPTALARFNDANESYLRRRAARLPALSRPVRWPPANPATGTGYYCCRCGHTGGCFTSAGDCRNNMMYAQWRFGQCREQGGVAPPA